MKHDKTSKIIITGARGMLGMELCKMLSANNEILGIGRTSAILSSIQVVAADIIQPKVITQAICDFSPDIVIHAAAYTDVDGCELNPDKAHLVNGVGTKNVAIACQKCCAKLVYMSTDYVFDGEKTSPYNEDDVPNPINIYGQSKLEGERYVTELLDEWFIVRAAWLFGKGGKNFVDTILQLAKQKDELRVVKDQVGCPTYCVDLAKEISRLIATEEYGIYHITNKGYCSWYKFACEIVKIAGFDLVKVIPITSRELCRPARRPCNSVLAHHRLQHTIGDNMPTWQDALKRYIEGEYGYN